MGVRVFCGPLYVIIEKKLSRVTKKVSVYISKGGGGIENRKIIKSEGPDGEKQLGQGRLNYTLQETAHSERDVNFRNFRNFPN